MSAVLVVGWSEVASAFVVVAGDGVLFNLHSCVFD